MRALLLLLLVLSGCGGCVARQQVVVVRMDVLCTPISEDPLILNCADTQTWAEYQERQKRRRLAF
jgi:hypothetical protein